MQLEKRLELDGKHMDILKNGGLDLIQIYRKGVVVQFMKHKLTNSSLIKRMKSWKKKVTGGISTGS